MGEGRPHSVHLEDMPGSFQSGCQVAVTDQT